MQEHEKRGAPRVPYISEVVCEGAGTRLVARTSDISASGVFIHSQLCCEAGSILKVRFSVTSTEIEAIGEVCYSIPYIGMGVRFLDLKPEYQSAIVSLIETQRAQGGGEAKTQDRLTIPSGVEPVDKFLGGLERAHLYLTHGDASGKSLFGIAFLIEGLKRGEPGALITPLSKEDAVRRFARLGHDCAEDLRTGALVLFKYSQSVVEQVRQAHHLEPLFRELGPILDETSPERIVFDSVDNLLASAKPADVTARASELAIWVRSFGATVVLVANEDNYGVIETLTPSVKESFRFVTKEYPDRVVRFIAFEKSPRIQDQAVRVDPSRGISLLEEQQTDDSANEVLEATPKESTGLDEATRNSEEHPIITLGDEFETRDIPTATSFASAVDFSTPPLAGQPEPGVDELPTLIPTISIGPHDVFFAMLDELQSFASSLEPETAEREERLRSA